MALNRQQAIIWHGDSLTDAQIHHWPSMNYEATGFCGISSSILNDITWSAKGGTESYIAKIYLKKIFYACGALCLLIQCSDDIMNTMASHFTGVSIVYSTVCLGAYTTAWNVYLWWRHDMETHSVLLTVCDRNHRSSVDSPVNPLSQDL